MVTSTKELDAMEGMAKKQRSRETLLLVQILRELRQLSTLEESQGAKLSEVPSPVNPVLNGKLDCMEKAAMMMHELGKLLWVSDKKFRVTVVCDPEEGRFEAIREDI
ncbi:MAG: hypothetical protein HFG24_02070 [Anaerotruncus sp.]|nr:hypothetical protein [Anaerotruncus sp.]